MTFPPGTRVMTPHGPGTVVYVRLTPPDFREPAVYSVALDAQLVRPRDHGTNVDADETQLIADTTDKAVTR